MKMALTREQKRVKIINERAKAIEIIDRIESLIVFGNRAGMEETGLAQAKLCDIENLIGRYRRGEA
jgi:hypothetical protein